MPRMGLRFRRSFRLMPGNQLNVSKTGMSASVGRRGAWLTVGPKGTRATVGIPGTGLGYTEHSAWARPKPHASQTSAPGIEVAELPREEIDVLPVPVPAPFPAQALASDNEQADPRLLPIVIVIVTLIAAAAVMWALLI